jgi:hypothetical protein
MADERDPAAGVESEAEPQPAAEPDPAAEPPAEPQPDEPASPFEPDAQVARVAVTYAADCVDLARSGHAIELDYTIASVAGAEELAKRIVATTPRFSLHPRERDETLDDEANMLGFYVAEVVRHEWGGEHGWVQPSDGARRTGMRLPDGSLCEPVERARQRLLRGSEYDLVAYVAGLREGWTD